MSRRTKLLIFATIVALLVVPVFWWLRPYSPSVAANTPPSTPASETVPSTPEPQSAPGSPVRQTDGNKFGALATLSAVPIEFYGKVIDQDRKPLPGVEVVGGTGSTTGFMQQETRTYTTSTDGSGLFTFKGFRGDALIIDLKKQGYNFESDRIRFHYSPIGLNKKRFTPERDRPVVFQMWKSLGAEPMIHYKNSDMSIAPDGTSVRIDLAKGKKVDAGGDLLVSVKWGRRDDPGSYLFDWSAKLGVPEGGIMESDGDVKFLAPIDGYQPSIEYYFTAADRHVPFARDYYVVSRNQQLYGRIGISLQNQPGRSEADIGLRVWLNPKPGSRNLEYDPAKQASAR